MDKPITLPILFMTEDQNVLYKLGIDQEYTIENSDIRNVNFFSINFTYPSFQKQFSIIGSNGETFVCPMSIDKVLKIIQSNG